MKKSVLITTVILVCIMALVAGTAGILAYRYFTLTNSDSTGIRTFDDCVGKGYPVMESFPERCTTPKGATFVKTLPEQTVTVVGEVECLPHKDKEGPQTLECAFGIKDANGVHYGLSDPELKFIGTLPTGIKVSITGIFRSNTDNNSKYNSAGTIEIKSLKKTP